MSNLNKLISCTWMSIDALSGELPLFLLYVNKFQNRLHRIDATKHTLPTIQRSLSCKKFSMASTFTPSKPPLNCSLFFLCFLNFVLAVCLTSLSLSFNAGPIVDMSRAGELQITKGGQSQQRKDVGNRERTLPLFHIRSKTSVSQWDKSWTGGTLALQQTEGS